MADLDPASNYRVIERLATGGMAEVFLAETQGLADFSKPVAIKRVLPHLAQNQKFIRMFLDEARLSARLNHRNIAQVFDVGRVDNSYFIVMEYVEGATLKTLLEYLLKQRRTMPVPLAIHVGIEIANGLHYAHRLEDRAGKPLGIVHRDVSPANVIVSRFGGVKIVDFGLAKAASQLEKTDPGVVKGKFGYVSPETAMGEEADFKTDLFATGILMWEMLAGRRLFHGERDWETLQLVRRAEVPSLREINPDVPEALDRAILTALARDKSDRHESVGAFSRELTRCLFAHGVPVSAEDVGALAREAAEGAKSSGNTGKHVAADHVSPLINEQVRKLTSPHKVQSVRPPPPDHDDDPPVSDVDELSDPGASTRTVGNVSWESAWSGHRDDNGSPSAPAAITSIAEDELRDARTNARSRARRRGGISRVLGAGLGLGVVITGGILLARAQRGRTIVGGDRAALAASRPSASGATLAAAAVGSDALLPPARSQPVEIRPAAVATEQPARRAAQVVPNAPAHADLIAMAPAEAHRGEALASVPGTRARTELYDAIEVRVHECNRIHGRHGRHARVYVTYEGASGRAVEVQLIGPYFAGRPIQACIEQAARDVVGPRFTSQRWSTDYSFMIQ